MMERGSMAGYLKRSGTMVGQGWRSHWPVTWRSLTLGAWGGFDGFNWFVHSKRSVFC